MEKYEIYEEHFDQIKSDQHFQLKVDDQLINCKIRVGRVVKFLDYFGENYF